jgi:nitrite reductase (NADH) large subunit
LSSVLAGEKAVDEIVINPRQWYADHDIMLLTGQPVTAIDPAAATITVADRTVIRYDKLLLATGSKPPAPAIPGLSLSGVRAFRDIGDVDAMVAASRNHRRAVVIGGGLLGLEAAWGLKRRGMAVAVVHLMPTLMERQLDTTAGELLQRDLDARGIAFFTNGQTEEILGTDRAEGVLLADGRQIPADLVVLAIGIRPSIDLARAAGLDVNRGLLVGDDMRTSDPNIYAVGECIEHNGQVFGLVGPIWEQAKVCGARLAGDEEAVYVPPPVFTSLKITGIDVFSAGALAAADEADEEITLHDARRGIYKKLILRNDRIVGSVLYGSVADGPWYVELMREKVDVSAFRDQLVFGRVFAGRAGAPQPAARRRRDGRYRSGLRLQRRLERADLCGDPKPRADHTRCGARSHQSIGVMRPVHRQSRGDPRASRRDTIRTRRYANAPSMATMRCAVRSEPNG